MPPDRPENDVPDVWASGPKRRRAPDDRDPRPRRRWARALLLVAGGIVVLIVLLLAFLPTIISALAPAKVGFDADGRPSGELTLRDVSLSWTGPQRIGEARLTDAQGRTAAAVSVTSDAALLDVVFGALGLADLDLGTTRLSGEARIVRGPDGRTNIEEIFDLPSDEPTEPVRLPEGLRARLNVENLTITYIDARDAYAAGPAAVARLPDLVADAAIQTGGPASLTLATSILHGPDEASLGPGGRLSIDASTDGLTSADGELTPASARIDATVTADGVAVPVLDALAGMGDRLRLALGDRLDATVRVQGSARDATATLAASSPRLRADVALAYLDGVLRASGPGEITLDTAGLAPLLEEPDGAVRFTQLPRVQLTLEALRLHAPIDGSPIDLRGSSARLAVRAGETAGTAVLPGGDGAASGEPRPFQIAPLELVLDAPDLAQTVRLTGGTSATVSGQSAGHVSVDVAASGLLDAQGRPRGLPGSLEGALVVDEVATAIAEPFIPAGAIDLPTDVGPVLSLELRAATLSEGRTGGEPPTRLTLAAEAANLRAAGEVTVEQRVVAGERALHLRLERLGPLLSRVLADAGVRVRSGGPLEVSITDLRADLARLGGESQDLRAIAARASLTTGVIDGTLAREGEPERTWQIAPATVRLDASDLARAALLTADTSLTVDGQPAGSVDVDLRAAGLLDEVGAPVAGLPRVLEGSARLADISTALAQPLVAGLGLDLPRDVGPTLNIELTAGTDEAPPRATLPPTRLTLSGQAEHLTARAAALVSTEAITTTGDGIALTLRRAAPIVAALLGPGTRPRGDGTIALRAGGLVVPLEDGRPRLDRAAGQATLRTGGYALLVPAAAAAEASAPAAAADRITVRSVNLTATLSPQAPPRLVLDASLQHEDQPVQATADLTLAGLFAAPAGVPPLLPVRPIGQVELKALPTALVRLAAPGAASTGGLDLARLVREGVGPSLDLTVVSRGEGARGPLNVAVTARGDRLTANTSARIGDEAIELRETSLRSRLTPALAATLIEAFAPDLTPRPRLGGPSNLIVTISPLAIPLGEGLSPALAEAPEAQVVARLDGAAVVRGLTVAGAAPGERRDLGPIGIAEAELRATIPPAALAAGAEGPRTLSAALTARLLGGPEEPLGTLRADLKAALERGAPAGPLRADIELVDVQTTGLDRLAGEPGLVSGALGPRVSVRANVEAQMTPAEGEAPASLRQADIRANIESPRLRTAGPLAARLTPEALALAAPMEVRWEVDPAWASRFLEPSPGAPATPPPGAISRAPDAPAGDGAAPAAPAARFIAPMSVALRVPALAIAMDQAGGPLRPGVFRLDAEATVPTVRMELAGGVPAVLENVRLALRGGQQPGSLAFDLRAENAGAAARGPNAAGAAPGGRVLVEGVVRELADPAGVLTPERAAITATVDVDQLPTALVDALARQEGVLVEALGPTVSIDGRAEGLSTRAGTVGLEAVAPRARAVVRGSVRDGVFVSDGPVVAQVLEVTPDLGRMLVTGLPVLGTFQKPREAEPAEVRATGLTVPLDGTLARLNGELTIDPGSARFQTSQAFAALLKGAGARQAGAIGERLEPLKLAIREGVVTYERYRLPLGEFAVETRGTVDLVNRRLDVITYVPFGALSDEAAGVFSSSVGQALGGAGLLRAATMVPLRTSGSFDQSQTRPDLELFAREFTSQLTPEQLLRGGLEGLLDGQRQRPSPSGGGG